VARLAPRLPVRAFFRFCTVAGVLGIGGAAVLYVLVEYAGVHYLVAGAINCLAVTMLSYHGNSVYTYGRFAGPSGFARFLLSRLGSILVGTSLYVLMTVVFGIWYLASSLLSAALANVLLFVVSHRWVWSAPFRARADGEP
jgi:putative flippase GtrA